MFLILYTLFLDLRFIEKYTSPGARVISTCNDEGESSVAKVMHAYFLDTQDQAALSDAEFQKRVRIAGFLCGAHGLGRKHLSSVCIFNLVEHDCWIKNFRAFRKEQKAQLKSALAQSMVFYSRFHESSKLYKSKP